MKKYTVRYMVTTRSRCGAYNYKERADVWAENPDEAKKYVKENAADWFGFKRCSVSIISIAE